MHRDGSTTLVVEINRAFRARTASYFFATCSSPTVRCADVVVPRVPPGLKFEARFHGSTLLHVEEISRRRSSTSGGGGSKDDGGNGDGGGGGGAVGEPEHDDAAREEGGAQRRQRQQQQDEEEEEEEEEEDVQLRIHLPPRPVGLIRMATVWSAGPCRNMPAGAEFPILLVPDEETADELRVGFCGSQSSEEHANPSSSSSSSLSMSLRTETKLRWGVAS